MVGKVVTLYSNEYSDSSIAQQAGYSAVEVATLVCFMVGVIQVNSLLDIFKRKKYTISHLSSFLR